MVGARLPSDEEHIRYWITRQKENVQLFQKPLHPAIQTFKDAIHNDPILFMLFYQMFEVPYSLLYSIILY